MLSSFWRVCRKLYLVAVPKRAQKSVKVFHGRLEVALLKLRGKVAAVNQNIPVFFREACRSRRCVITQDGMRKEFAKTHASGRGRGRVDRGNVKSTPFLKSAMTFSILPSTRARAAPARAPPAAARCVRVPRRNPRATELVNTRSKRRPATRIYVAQPLNLHG